MQPIRVARFLGFSTLALSLAAGSLGSVRPSAAHAHLAASGSLVLYSAQGYDSAMAKAYGKASGTSVLLTDDSTGNILAEITAEQNNPTGTWCGSTAMPPCRPWTTRDCSSSGPLLI
ncbi:MAG TPA: hypothetical protein VN837_20895 [Chloroflexota bacterium]|nr:hypothetical protein [Chloroflexota bacterium]